MPRWTYRLDRPLTPAEAAVIEEIAGVTYKRNLSVPENACAPVSRALAAIGVAFTPLAPHDRVRDSIRDAGLALRSMRAEVPGYGKFPDFLTAYQKRGLVAALRMPNGSGHLWWATGSGKALAAIIWGLAGRGRVVIVTKGAVKYQFAGEVRKFTTLAPTVLDGMNGTEIPIDATIVLLNYDILPGWIDAIERWAAGWQEKPSVVFDESQKVASKKRWNVVAEKEPDASEGESSNGRTADFGSAYEGSSPSSPTPLPEPKVKFTLLDNIAVAAMRLSALAARRLCTTATPMNDRVRNLWAQLDLAHPYEWGPYWGKPGTRRGWAIRYCNAIERTFGGMDDSGKSNEAELVERLRVVSHRVTKAEANALLPPLRRIVTYVTIPQQVRATGASAELRAVMRSGNPTAIREMLLMEAAGRKRRWLMERLDIAVEQGLKVCVFTGRHRDCDQLLEDMGRRFAGKASLVIGGHGGVPGAERIRMAEAYMAAKGPAILIGTIGAWGEGLNLQDTDLGIVAMLPYTPGQVIQTEGRWSRLGQARPVIVEYPVCEGTYDERVSEILLTKLPALSKIVDQDEVRSFGRELIGADDVNVVAALADKILNGAKRAKEAEDAA